MEQREGERDTDLEGEMWNVVSCGWVEREGEGECVGGRVVIHMSLQWRCAHLHCQFGSCQWLLHVLGCVLLFGFCFRVLSHNSGGVVVAVGGVIVGNIVGELVVCGALWW